MNFGDSPIGCIELQKLRGPLGALGALGTPWGPGGPGTGRHTRGEEIGLRGQAMQSWYLGHGERRQSNNQWLHGKKKTGESFIFLGIGTKILLP